jgi:hypothetical protein
MVKKATKPAELHLPKLSNLPKYYIWPALTLALILGLSVLVVKPQIENIFKLRSQVVKQRERLKQLTEKASLLESTSKDELTKKVKKTEEVFPSEKPAIQVINTISYLSQQAEVVFSGVELSPGMLSTPSAKAKKEKISKLPSIQAGFTVDGSKENVFKFFDSLEKATPIMRIEGLSLSLTEAPDLIDIMSGAIEVSVFYKQPPQSIGKVDSPLTLLTAEETAALTTIEGFVSLPQFAPNTQDLGKENLFEF